MRPDGLLYLNNEAEDIEIPLFVELDLSLRILEDVAQQPAAVRQQWERRVEGARYEADLAQRRYRQVDPEN